MAIRKILNQGEMDRGIPAKISFDATHVFLAIVLFFSLVYVIYSVWQKGQSSHSGLDEKSLSSVNEVMTLPEASLRPLSYYEEKAARRDLFNLSSSTQDPGISGGPNHVPGDDLPEIRNLQLKGIMLDQNPQAIIQDPVSSQSFFVYQGDRIKGAVVKHIDVEKVVLEYQGQTIELIRK